jgi:hypothetical protein
MRAKHRKQPVVRILNPQLARPKKYTSLKSAAGLVARGEARWQGPASNPREAIRLLEQPWIRTMRALDRVCREGAPAVAPGAVGYDQVQRTMTLPEIAKIPVVMPEKLATEQARSPRRRSAGRNGPVRTVALAGTPTTPATSSTSSTGFTGRPSRVMTGDAR